MLHTIETDNRAVAITNDSEVVARLNGLDPVLRETARHLKRAGQPLWDGESPFTSRPATDAEQAAYEHWARRQGCRQGCCVAGVLASPQTVARLLARVLA